MITLEKANDTYAYIARCLPALDSGQNIPLPVIGGSMVPFLVHRRDTVWLRKPTGAPKRGQLVLYQRSNGAYVLHRICKVHNGKCTMVGDAQTILEPHISPEQIRGEVFEVLRKGQRVTPHHFIWFFFSQIWIRVVPLRPFFIKLYSLFR